MNFKNIAKIVLQLSVVSVCMDNGYTMICDTENTGESGLSETGCQKIKNLVEDGTNQCPVYTMEVEVDKDIKNGRLADRKFFQKFINVAFRYHVNINKFYKDKETLMRNPEFLAGLFGKNETQIIIPGRSNESFLKVWRWITRCRVIVHHGTKFTTLSLITDIFPSVLKNIRDRYCCFQDPEFNFVKKDIDDSIELSKRVRNLDDEKLSERFFKVEDMWKFLKNFKGVIDKYYPFPTKSLPELNPKWTKYYERFKPEYLKSASDWKMFPEWDTPTQSQFIEAHHKSTCKIDEILERYGKAKTRLISLVQLCIEDLSEI